MFIFPFMPKPPRTIHELRAAEMCPPKKEKVILPSYGETADSCAGVWISDAVVCISDIVISHYEDE